MVGTKTKQLRRCCMTLPRIRKAWQHLRKLDRPLETKLRQSLATVLTLGLTRNPHGANAKRPISPLYLINRRCLCSSRSPTKPITPKRSCSTTRSLVMHFGSVSMVAKKERYGTTSHLRRYSTKPFPVACQKDFLG